MDANAYDALMQRMAAVLERINASYDRLVEFVDEQRQINHAQVQINERLERLLAEVIRQRRNGHNGEGR